MFFHDKYGKTKSAQIYIVGPPPILLFVSFLPFLYCSVYWKKNFDNTEFICESFIGLCLCYCRNKCNSLYLWNLVAPIRLEPRCPAWNVGWDMDSDINSLPFRYILGGSHQVTESVIKPYFRNYICHMYWKPSSIYNRSNKR